MRFLHFHPAVLILSFTLRVFEKHKIYAAHRRQNGEFMNNEKYKLPYEEAVVSVVLLSNDDLICTSGLEGGPVDPESWA